jgi:hypothetical protein
MVRAKGQGCVRSYPAPVRIGGLMDSRAVSVACFKVQMSLTHTLPDQDIETTFLIPRAVARILACTHRVQSCEEHRCPVRWRLRELRNSHHDSATVGAGSVQGP